MGLQCLGESIQLTVSDSRAKECRDNFTQDPVPTAGYTIMEVPQYRELFGLASATPQPWFTMGSHLFVRVRVLFALHILFLLAGTVSCIKYAQTGTYSPRNDTFFALDFPFLRPPGDPGSTQANKK